MSTTRSQKRRNNLEENTETISEVSISLVEIENSDLEQDLSVSRPFNAKYPRIENSVLESLRASLKEEIFSEIKSLLVECQKDVLKLLKPKTGEKVREKYENDMVNETRCFFTPTKSLMINSTERSDPSASRNTRHTKHFRFNY